MTESGVDDLIWATRGRSWGFRFLLDGGYDDPLPVYERVYAGLGDEPTGWARVGPLVALRFLDPDGRKDQSGRVIPHDFVVSGALAGRALSLEDGERTVWALVGGVYAELWESPNPPAGSELRGMF